MGMYGWMRLKSVYISIKKLEKKLEKNRMVTNIYNYLETT